MHSFEVPMPRKLTRRSSSSNARSKTSFLSKAKVLEALYYVICELQGWPIPHHTGGFICELDVVAGSPWALGAVTAAAAGASNSPAGPHPSKGRGSRRLSFPLRDIQAPAASAAGKEAFGAGRMAEVLNLTRRRNLAVQPNLTGLPHNATASTARTHHSTCMHSGRRPRGSSFTDADNQENNPPSATQLHASQLHTLPLHSSGAGGNAHHHTGKKLTSSAMKPNKTVSKSMSVVVPPALVSSCQC
jgi:hypothetical protein